MQRGKFNIVIGGQAGSESKGKMSGWLCDKHQPEMIVMTASPNAGHTVIDKKGIKKVSYHLPIGAVMCEGIIILTAASLINTDILAREIKDLGIDPARIMVDPRASIIHSGHVAKERDNGMSDIGSTLQGIGECRMGKMMRKGRGHHTLAHHIDDLFAGIGVEVASQPTSVMINNHLRDNGMALCESTQGFDLDLEHGIDPVYCTSKMINPAMAMAEAGVSPALIGDVYGVIRPYPIRVNNRTGTSGPYADAKEITWAEVALRSGFPGPVESFGEITTTTKLPRRVFEFSWQRFAHFIRVCRPNFLCLQFANYLDWKVFGMSDLETLRARQEENCAVWDFINELEMRGGVRVDFIGTGPAHNQMIECGRR